MRVKTEAVAGNHRYWYDCAWGDVGDSVPAVRYCIVSAVLIASGCATREFGTAGVMYVGQEHLNVAK